jgi:dTDP-4-amino-4,6-dideoxygalactose transaminase
MTQEQIPLVDLSWQFEKVWPVVSGQIAEIARSGAFISGEQVAKFEAAYATHVSANHCIGVGNGGDALELALRACSIGVGDEVILPTNSFAATAMSVQRIGAIPHFVDPRELDFLINPEILSTAIGKKTKAIVPVHLFGQMANMQEISAIAKQHGLKLIEDGAQSQGALQNNQNPGMFSDAVATSFYPGKNLGAFGDAGAVTTNDPLIAERIKQLRNYGGIKKYEHVVPGYNSRLDTLQAAVLIEKLKFLTEWNQLRSIAAKRYSQNLESIESIRLPIESPGNYHVWHLFVVRVSNRDEIFKRLSQLGIGVGIHYPDPIHTMNAFAENSKRSGDLNVSESIAGEILSLPIFPGITTHQIDFVCNSLIDSVLAQN